MNMDVRSSTGQVVYYINNIISSNKNDMAVITPKPCCRK